MGEPATEAVAAFSAKEAWSAEDHAELMRQLFYIRNSPRKFKAAVAEMEAAAPDPRGAVALKLGIAYYMLCRFADALKVLANATDNKDRRYFQAQCFKSLRQYDKAAEEMERAEDRGWPAPSADLELAELAALAGNLGAAEKSLAKLESPLGQTADFHYVRGLVDELSGRGEAAQEAYVKARSIDPTHAAATFRLAYFHDLHGDEEQALQLYRECVSRPPVYASALMNMAVLYEDAGKFGKAEWCARQVLAVNPNHERAKLFLKDAEACRSMYYDEDQARRIARRNAVLDIPVTDFELSVRARNCLKKMNIRCLGDLVQTNETGLLAYKNFGETSLKEIKEMLDAKGLKLGMSQEEEAEVGEGEPSASAGPGERGIFSTPVEQIDFSVRSRKALETLKVHTLGELVSKTEADLLACRNFGQTSLNEIRQRLAEYGLKLREPN